MIQKIRQFVKGGKRTLLSAKTANEVVRPLNALLNMRIQRGANDSVMFSDNGVVITLARSGVGSGGSDGGTSDALTTQHPSVGTEVTDYVSRIVVNADDEVFIAGQFATVDGIRRQGIAAFSEVLALKTVDWFLSQGNVAGSGTTYATTAHTVSDMVAGPSGTLYICGSDFAYVNNTRRGYSNVSVDPPPICGVAKIAQASGEVSGGFAPAPSTAAGYPKLIVPVDSGVLVFGVDDWDVGTDLGALIRLDATTGARDLTFAAGGFTVTPTGALHVGSDLVYCVGSFTDYGGVTRNRILRLLGDTLDASFEPVSGFNGATNVIVSDGGSSFIVGGDFTTYDGTAAVRLAKINGSAELDGTWTASANGAVSALCVQDDGKVLVGGSFTQVNSTARSRLARLNSDGTLDTSFDCSVNDDVAAIAVQSGGQIVIGGSFTTVGGATRNRLARLSATGTVL